MGEGAGSIPPGVVQDKTYPSISLAVDTGAPSGDMVVALGRVVSCSLA